MAQELEISSEFLNTLEKADKKLKKLNKTTDQLDKTFSSLVNGSLTSFSQKLGEITNAVSNISKAKIGDLGIEKVTNDATKAADAVNTVTQAVSKMGNSAKFTPVAELKQWAKAIKDEIGTNTKLTPKEHQSLVDELYKTEAQIKAQMVSTEQAQIKASQEVQKQEQKKRKAIQDTTKALEAQQKSFEASVRRAESRNDKRDALIARQDAIRSEAVLNTYSGAINYSQSATTMAQQTTAIQHLKKARENLDRSSFKSNAEYRYAVQQLNKEIKRQQKEVDKLTGSYEQQSGILGELGRTATTVFSVRALLNYGKQIVQTTGEFEMMNKSLQVLLQDKRAADQLWEKTIALAQKSPFTIKQLLTSTKQLAAYRVESEKLYEVNSMLSDISAGLGVEMNRLVLAYGQVKAANFLRGTELRQFSEAGVNMLEELSKYFTEVEGRAVSVGEVFEMVSKRQVSFEDVDEVLHRITSEGGIFYKMQEEQAKTIQGMIRNLQDAMDVMKNEIGSNSSGLIKGTLSLIVTMVKNWRIMGTVLKMIGTYLLLNKIATKGWGSEAKSLSGYFSSAKRELGGMLKNFGQFLKNNKGNLIATAIVGAVTGIVSYVRKLNEVNEAYDEQVRQAFTAMSSIDELSSKYDSLSESLKNTALSEEERNEKLKEEQTIVDELIKKYPQLAALRGDESGDGDEGLFDMAHDIELFRAKVAEDSKASFWHDSFGTQVDEFREAQDDVEVLSSFLRESIKSLSQDEKFLSQLNNSQKGLFDSIYATMTDRTSSLEDVFTASYKFINNFSSDLQSEANLMEDAFDAAQDFLGEMKGDWDYFGQLWNLEASFSRMIGPNLRLFTANEDYKALAEKDADEAAKALGRIVDAELNQLSKGIPAVQKKLQEFAKEYFASQPIPIDINFEYNVGEGGEKELGPQMQRIYDEISKINSDLMTEIGNDKDYTIPLPQFKEEPEQYIQKVREFFERMSVEIQKGQLLFSKEEQEKMKAVSEQMATVYAILNLAMPTSKGGGGSQKNTFDARLRVLKDLNKEYKELTKYYSAIEAKEIAIAKFGPAFSEAFKGTKKTINDFAWDTEQGIIDALDWLATFGRQADRIKAKHARAEFVWEVKIKQRQEEIKGKKGLVEDLFEEFELAKEFEKMSLDVEIPLNILGVKVTDEKKLKESIKEGLFGDVIDQMLAMTDEATAQFYQVANTGGYDFTFAQSNRSTDDTEVKTATNQGRKDALKEIRDLVTDLKSGEKTIKTLIDEDKNLLQQWYGAGFFDILSSGSDSLFDNLEGNKAKIIELYGEELYNIYVDAMEKIAETQRKTDEDTLKELMKSFEATFGERTQIVNKYYKDYAEILRLLPRDYGIDSTDKNTLKRQKMLNLLNDRLKQDLTRLEIDAFRSSEEFINMFENLEGASEDAINTMIVQLDALLDNKSASMTISEIKELTDKLHELRAAALKLKDPFEVVQDFFNPSKERLGMDDLITKYGITSISDVYQHIQNALSVEYGKYSEQTKAIESLQALIGLNKDEFKNLGTFALPTTSEEDLNTINSLIIKYRNDYEGFIKAIQELINAKKREQNNTKQNINTYEDEKSAVEDVAQAYRNQAGVLRKMGGEVEKLFNALADLSTVFGVELPITEALLGLGSQLTQITTETLASHKEFKALQSTAQGFEKTLNGLMAASNWVIFALQVASAIISVIANYRQEQFNKKIESHQKEVEKLEKSYSKLEKSMDKAYNVQRIRELNAEMENNLRLQIAEAKAAQAAAEAAYAAKDNDENESKVEETTEAVEAATEALEDFLNTKNEPYTGGVFDEVISDAEAFVDAWLGAFEETGDGLSGLEDQFTESLKNIVRRQVALQFVGNYVKGWQDELNKYLSSGGELTPEEITQYAETIRSEFPELSAQLEEFYKALGTTLDGTGELSGLQKGIQGISEATAEVIASYLNSLRFYVADSNSRIANIERFIGNNTETNPMLAQLEIIAEQTNAIRKMLSNVVNGNHIRVDLINS